MAKTITENDERILKAQDVSTLAEWWAVLNKYGWPDALPDPEPEEHISGGRRSEIMDWIGDLVGHRNCLRAWNRDRMTDAEFDDWWAVKFEESTDPDVLARYQQWQKRAIERMKAAVSLSLSATTP